MKNTKAIILDCIINFIKENKYAPTVREIGAMAGLKSNSSVSAHLSRMQIDGQLKYDEKSPRTIVIPGYAYVKIPKGMTEKELNELLRQQEMIN